MLVLMCVCVYIVDNVGYLHHGAVFGTCTNIEVLEILDCELKVRLTLRGNRRPAWGGVRSAEGGVSGGVSSMFKRPDYIPSGTS